MNAHTRARMLVFLFLSILASSTALDTCGGSLVRLTSSLSPRPMLAAQSYLGLFLNSSLKGYLEAASPLDACSPLPTNVKGSILLVIRGNCSFLEKAIHVNESGSTAMLLMDNMDGCINMGAEDNETSLIDSLNIYSLSISQRTGLSLLSWLSEAGRSPVDVALEPLDERMDPSVLFLLLLASITVVLGSLWSGHDYSLALSQEHRSRQGSTQQLTQEAMPTQELQTGHAIAFIVFASAFLLILFFFLNSVVFYLLLVLVSISFTQSTNLLLSALLKAALPKLTPRQVTLPFLGEILVSELIPFPFVTTAVIVWAIERNEPYAWILQDLFGISLMLLVLRVLTIQSLKVATALLCLAFFYDIFWVFLSPFFFGSSVMVTVARGGTSGEDLPMLLKVPSFFLPYEFTHYSMLGYGDVILPGLLVAFLRRFEIQKGNSSIVSARVSYFFLSSVSYVTGLLLTFAALYFSWFGDQGQPALLYLVPCTLGSTFSLAWSRGEVVVLWRGIKEATGVANESPEEEGQPLMAPHETAVP